MDWWLFSFFIGSILALFLPITPTLFYVLLLIVVSLFFLSYKPLQTTSGFIIGCVWIIFNGTIYNTTLERNELSVVKGKLVQIAKIEVSHSHIKNKNKAQQLSIIGEILTIPVKKNSHSGTRFNFKISHINHQPIASPFNIRLSWNKGPEKLALKQGQEWRLIVKIKPAHGFSNPGGFSYQTWLRQKNIVATGYVVENNKTKKLTLGSNQNILLKNTSTLRQSLFSHFVKILPEHQLSALLVALSFGERSFINEEVWQTLKNTGTQHLIAISGLHLGLVSSGSFVLLIFIIGLLPLSKFKNEQLKTCFLQLNSQLIAVCISCSLAVFYAYMAGFSQPTVRALVMLLLYWGARLIGIKLTLVRGLLMAVFIMIILNPLTLVSSSFWLSIYAVTVIFIILWRFTTVLSNSKGIVKSLKSLCLMQVGLTVLMLPIAAMFNYQITMGSILANIVAVPFMSFTCIPLSILAVLFLPINEQISLLLLKVALKSLEVIWQWLLLLGRQDWALLSVSSNQIFLLALVLITGSLYLVLTNVKAQISLIFLASFLISAFQFNEKPKGWVVNVMDVGQGLAVVIERNGHVILYDTGASYPSGFNLGDAVLLPYLKHRGVKVIDKMIISHSDNDHAGNLSKLKQSLKIKEVLANDSKLSADKPCLKGSDFSWQGLRFTILSPLDINKTSEKSEEQDRFGKNNDDSCVINISDGRKSVLLTGDISKRVERQLISEHKKGNVNLSADVLVAPHHGSKTSSSHDFISKVSAKSVVFSTGYLNRWHMPNESVVARYKTANYRIYNTADDGMVEISILDEKLKIKSYRKDLWPFWMAN